MDVNGHLQAFVALSLGESAPGTLWIGDCVGPRADLNAVERIIRYNSTACENSL
jgi:hypothetical protein